MKSEQLSDPGAGPHNSRCAQEKQDARVRRLYQSEGGPLLGWLIEEAHLRGLGMQELARELGVTYGYIAQLRSGHRSISNISKEFAASCACFLGVPTVVVLLLSGFLDVRDFATRAESHQDLVDRAIARLSHERQLGPSFGSVDLTCLPIEAKQVIVNLYSELLGEDVFGCRHIPQMVMFLQRAAVLHGEREAYGVV